MPVSSSNIYLSIIYLIHILIIKEKEDMNLRETKGPYTGEVGKRKGKGGRNYVIIF